MTAWTDERRERERRAGEVVLFDKKGAGSVRVCLVYPNRYALAMGNLGFQTVYRLFDEFPGVMCGRAFLPDDGGASLADGTLRSFESRTPVSEFDLIAFSVSFETDYWHVARMLRLIGIEQSSRDRRGHAPPVIAGGPAVFLNPEPLADFVDLFLIGEAEEMLPEFLQVLVELLDAHGRDPTKLVDALLERSAREIRGAYDPQSHVPAFDGARTVHVEHRGPGPATIERRLIWDLNAFATTTQVLSDEAVFGDMVLVEASRGCQWGCRFCAAGYMYRPIRTRGVDQLEAAVRAGLDKRKTIGLVGAEMGSVPGVDRLSQIAADAGGRLSPSSLKADCVTPALAGALSRGGNRSATVAPEAGSERMRRVINKNLSEEDILRAADLLVGGGVEDLKLYFMVGLPTEEMEDVLAVAELTTRVRERVEASGKGRPRIGRTTVSVNPFVPKPWTPFQWDPMEDTGSLKSKFARLRRELGRVPNVKVDTESPREGYFQTLLSRGDRRMATFLRAVDAADGDWWLAIRSWQRDGLGDLPHPDSYVHRTYDQDEILPWDFIDHRIAKGYLWTERRKAFAARQTPPCDTTTCHSCAAC